jgi:hypothetical protein
MKQPSDIAACGRDAEGPSPRPMIFRVRQLASAGNLVTPVRLNLASLVQPALRFLPDSRELT